MRQALKVSDLIQSKNKKEVSKKIEITHYILSGLWLEMDTPIDKTQTLVYLGKCSVDGDMFACYGGDTIVICKGHLNDGTY